MTIPTRPATLLLASMLALSGCFGSSDDKGDNGDSKLITPKPSTAQDANTAGSREKFLPDPVKADNANADNPTDAGPK